ncbi:hypothetical protein PRIPAC_70860 [Pristionchus pacificus]|uniref:Uncharacterized protein n=1 Tax=Pristionchus pacificus TaxID=54126 RepID=A0A2A6C169_PRIPA|nr:hypothetical protein PRIPAC_70860 [Pristionchus pacificus]|eukprot:PDM71773.1 hypothetical protein PRIPAC_38180 [Pristionchus pacificus]
MKRTKQRQLRFRRILPTPFIRKFRTLTKKKHDVEKKLLIGDFHFSDNWLDARRRFSWINCVVGYKETFEIQNYSSAIFSEIPWRPAI